MTRAFWCVLLLALAASAASSQSRLWDELNGVAGFTTIQEGAGGRLFGIRGDAVVYTSSDRGLTWRGTTVLGGSVVSLFARGPRVIAARFDSRATNFYQFHLSTDNGDTWTRITTASNTNRTLMGFTDEGTAYAFFRDSFFGLPAGPYFLLRYDAGGTWQNSGVSLPGTVSASPNTITAALIDHAGDILFGCSVAGLVVTHDFGATWVQQFAGRGVTALAVTPDNSIYLAADPAVTDGGVYVSTDGARSWSYLGFSEKRVSALTADSAGNIIASTADGFYRLSPGGDTWDYASPFSELFNVMISTAGNTILASSGTWGQFRSNDGGTTWVQSGPRKRDVFSIVATPSGTTIAGTVGARTFVSFDDGANWTQALEGAICDNIFSLAAYGGTVYAGTECGIYRSTDEGLSWSSAGTDAETGPVASIAVQHDDGDVYAGTLFGVLRSSDGGLTWQQSGLGTERIVALATGPSGQVYAATARAGVFESDDDGASWMARGLVRDDIESIHADALGTLFVGCYGGVARSTDGGASWDEVTFTDGYVTGLASLGAQAVYAATPGGVFTSANEGASWTALDAAGLSYTHVLSLSFDARGVLFAGTYNGGVYRTSRTLTGIEESAPLPAAFGLAQNYPNPFNPETVVEYDVPAGAAVPVRVAVYDLLGREVATLAAGPQAPGAHRVRWNAGGLPGGVYFLRMLAGPHAEVRKMLLVR
jgi:hypothetical protein